MTIKDRNEISNEEIAKALKLYIQLYNKEPSNYNELLKFHNLMAEIIKTYNVTFEQINKEIIIKYNNLFND